MLHNLITGLTNLGSPQALAYLFGGSIVGMLLGVVPGVGGLVLLSILLSFMYHISVVGAICLFLASYAASFFSASVTSILLNTPAHPEAFAVTFDGFPMALRGEAGRALGISASSTCLGGFVGCAALIGLYQVINYLPNVFHPPEYVALISIALLLVGTLGSDSASKAIISAGIGLMISCIGTDPTTGYMRYTFGAIGLFSGVSLVALALGLFAVPQMILVYGTATTIARQDMLGNEVGPANPVDLEKGFGHQVVQGILETFRHWWIVVVSALIGVITGIIPGIGAFSANFLSYGVAQQVSRRDRRALFGTGIPEGIIAPESSSLSKEAGSMIPVLGLGIPGGVGGALFLAALTIKGIKVGFGFTQQYPVLSYEIVWVIALGGLIGTAAGLVLAPFLARITRVPGPLLVPPIMALAVIGPFVAETSFFTVMEVLVFTVVGLLLRRLRYSLAAFAIGLVLGPTLESNIYLTHTVFPGFTFLERPLTDVLTVIGIGILVLKTLELRRVRRQGEITDPEHQWERTHPYPLLAVAVVCAIVGVMTFTAWWGVAHYDFKTALLPVIASVIAGGGALWRLPFEARAYIEYRSRHHLGEDAASQTPSVEGGEAGGGLLRLANRTDLVEEYPQRIISTPQATILEVTHETAVSSELEEFSRRAGKEQDTPSRPPIVEKSWGWHGQYTRELTALLWFGGLVGLCYLVGFTIGIPAFVGLYGITATHRVLATWWGRVAFAGIAAAVMYGASFEMLNLLHLSFTPVFQI